MVSDPNQGSAADDDSDSTVELPVLDVESYEASRDDDDVDSTWNRPGEGYDKGTDASAADFEAEILALSGDVQKLRGQLERRDAELAERDGALVERDAALTEARAGLDQLSVERSTASAAADARMREVAAQLDQLTDVNQRLQHDTELLRQRAATHVERLRHAEGRQGVWEALLRDGDAAIQVAQSEQSEASRALAEAQVAMASLQAQLSDQTSRFAAADADRNEQAGRLAGDAQQLLTLRADIAQRSEELQQLQAVESGLRLQLHAAEQRVGDLEARQQETAANHAQLKLDVQKQTALHEAAAANVTKLEGELIEAREQAAMLTVERNATRERVEEANARLATLDERMLKAATLAAERTTALELRIRDAESRAYKLELELSVKAARLSALDTIARTDRGEPEPGVSSPARYLVLLDSPGESVFLLKPRTTVGRAEDNDIRLDRASVSRHHAVLHCGPKHSVIEDLGSTNGVVVKGRRTRRAMLRDGDVLYVGKCRLRYSEKPRHA